jgi:hypothetical protein
MLVHVTEASMDAVGFSYNLNCYIAGEEPFTIGATVSPLATVATANQVIEQAARAEAENRGHSFVLGNVVKVSGGAVSSTAI